MNNDENLLGAAAHVAPSGSANGLPEGVDLRALFGTLWRRRYLLLAVSVITTGLSAIYVQNVAPVYTAEAQVMIDTRSPRTLATGEVIPKLIPDDAFVKTQIEILSSNALINNIIDRLDLTKDPEFNPTLQPETSAVPGQWHLLGYTIDWSKIAASIDPAEQENTPAPSLDYEYLKHITAATFRSKLSVTEINFSYVLTVKFSSTDPEKSALIANEVVNEYLKSELQAKLMATRRTATSLSDRFAVLQKKAIEAETAVENYREKAGLVNGSNGSVTEQQLSELNTQLIAAQTERAKAEGRLEQLRGLIGKPGTLMAVPEVLESSLIEKMREQEANLQRKIAELSTRYKDSHPTLINARADLHNLRASITVEINKIINGLANHLDIAQTRERLLQQSLNEVTLKAAKNNRAAIKLHALQRDAEAATALSRAFMTRIKEATAQEGLAPSDLRLISEAVPPISPSYPKKGIMVGIVAVASMLLGSFVILLLECFNRGFLATEEIESSTGLRVLGLVPTVPRFSIYTAVSPGPWKNRILMRYLRFVFAAAIALVTGLSLLPDAAPGQGIDKTAHILAYLGLAVLAMVSFRRKQIALLAAGSMVGLGALLELFQSFSPGRVPSWEDLLADTVGVALGICVGLLFRPVLRHKPADPFNGSDFEFDEAIRSISIALSLSAGKARPATVLVTSTVPEEGKTVLSISLARQAGRSGKKCLLVDGDLRRPRLHDVLGASESPGLIDVLSGGKSLDEVINRDCETGIDLVTAGIYPGKKAQPIGDDRVFDHLPSSLGSPKMIEFLADAKSRYDLVIIDSSPVLPVSDTRVLCQMVDKTIFTVRWGKTRRKVVFFGLRQIMSEGAEMAGLVLSRVDRRKYVRYGFQDSDLFSPKIASYYRMHYLNAEPRGSKAQCQTAAVNGARSADELPFSAGIAGMEIQEKQAKSGARDLPTPAPTRHLSR